MDCSGCRYISRVDTNSVVNTPILHTGNLEIRKRIFSELNVPEAPASRAIFGRSNVLQVADALEINDSMKSIYLREKDISIHSSTPAITFYCAANKNNFYLGSVGTAFCVS